MQEAVLSPWAREPHSSGAMRGSLRELNHRFLDLAGSSADTWVQAARGGFTPDLARQVMPLSCVQRAAAADCPYALFDLKFQDEGHWRLRLSDNSCWRVADAGFIADETADFVRLALFYAWHVAATAQPAAQLLLGMHERTVVAFRRVTLDCLSALVATETANLTARWSQCRAYWDSLTRAAASPDAAGLRRVQLYGLQLAAAAQLR